MKKFILSAAVVSLFSFAARAADLPNTKGLPAFAPPPPPVFNWTGCHVGINGGYGWSRATDNIGFVNPPGAPGFFDPAFAAGSTPSLYSYNEDGGLGGGQVGCNFQTSQFVYGLEGDIDYSGMTGSESINTTTAPFFPGFGNATERLEWLSTVRGRLGYAVVPQVLLYATGGLAVGDEHSSYRWAYPGTGELYVGSASSARAGWTVGAGVEYAINVNWSVKLEYLYFDLGGLSYDGLPQTAATPPGGFHTVSTSDVRGSIVRAGLNYNFDLFAPATPIAAKY